MSENWDEGLGKRDVTPEEEGSADIHLDDPEDTDDVPWSPPDRMPIAGEFLADESEETIDERIAQEVPEEGTAYGAPEPEGILGGADDLSGQGVDGEGPADREMAGGEDPDAIPAEEDVLGGEAKEVEDGFSEGYEPAEQAAIHVTDEP